METKTLFQKFCSYIGLGPEDEYIISNGTTENGVHSNGVYSNGAHLSDAPAIQNHGGKLATMSFPTTPGVLQVVEPADFSDAQKIADYYMAGSPVIMNLESTDRKYARRLMDFASGLVYGLDGRMTKASKQVFILEPAGSHASNNSIQLYLENIQRAAPNN